MTRIYISLGSNIEREHHIRAGLDALHAEFGELTVSRVFESEAVGFAGRPFYNLVVGADTDLPLATLCQRLRAMEFAHGREPDAKKFAPRTLDLDLLLYGNLVCDVPVALPRGEILTNAFVLWPLANWHRACATRSMAARWTNCGKVTTRHPSDSAPFPFTGKRASCSITESTRAP